VANGEDGLPVGRHAPNRLAVRTSRVNVKKKIRLFMIISIEGFVSAGRKKTGSDHASTRLMSARRDSFCFDDHMGEMKNPCLESRERMG
jgi:hypothetical protein